MAKFKVGDKVKVVGNEAGDDYNRYLGKTGVIVEADDGMYPYMVEFDKEGGKYHDSKDVFGEQELALAKPGRPSKLKPIQFIAFYDETDGDPAKKFTSKKELNEWLKEAQKDENIIFDSIEVFPVGKPMKIEMSFKLKGVSDK